MAIVSLSKNTGQVQPNGVKCREFTQLVCSVDLTILVHLTKPIKLHNNGASCLWGHTDNRPVYSNAEEETLLFGVIQGQKNVESPSLETSLSFFF